MKKSLSLSFLLISCSFTSCFISKIKFDLSLRKNIKKTYLSLSSLTLSFSDLVEKQIIEKFGKEETKRVIASWHLLQKDYEHKEFLGDITSTNEDSSSNFIQHAHSYLPGLTARTFWDVKDHAWCKKLESKYKVILKEFKSVMSSKQEALEREGNNVWASMANKDAISYGRDWKTLVLMDRGFWDKTNCGFFPETAKAIRDCNVPVQEVFFASMQPNSSIKMHSDMVNFVLTSHLPLVIPQNGQNKCRLTVGDDTVQWMNGKVLLFDTSIMHDAINDTDEMRYVLMMRVWHPELTDIERQALGFTFDCLNFPELVTSSAEERFFIEQQVQAFHAYPGDIGKKEETVASQKKSKGKKKIRAAAKGFGA